MKFGRFVRIVDSTFLHVCADEGEDEAAVHDAEQVVQEEGQARVQSVHLPPEVRLVVLGDDLPREGGDHVHDVVVKLLGEPPLPGRGECTGGGQVLHHRLDHQLEVEPGAVQQPLPGLRTLNTCYMSPPGTHQNHHPRCSPPLK